LASVRGSAMIAIAGGDPRQGVGSLEGASSAGWVVVSARRCSLGRRWPAGVTGMGRLVAAAGAYIACTPSMDCEGRAGFPASGRGSQSLAAIPMGSSPHIAPVNGSSLTRPAHHVDDLSFGRSSPDRMAHLGAQRATTVAANVTCGAIRRLLRLDRPPTAHAEPCERPHRREILCVQCGERPACWVDCRMTSVGRSA
jgi:hypothetical protein